MKRFLFIVEGFFNLFKNVIGFTSKKDKILFNKRLDICLNCKYFDESYCLQCGCYVYAKTKVHFKLDENEKSIDGCPKKYW